jgi:mannose-6-phosphate isomerase-like protein (cupin superfamily)
MDKINISQVFEQIHDHWNPRIAAEVNDFAVKFVKVQGEFDWHHHEWEDELFLVVRGRLKMEFRDREVWVEEGEFIVVPHGIEHRPVAPAEVHVLLIEPTSTLNTGNMITSRTVAAPKRI